jgi:uncharacterized glyoxalase superfamily protein PhnB
MTAAAKPIPDGFNTLSAHVVVRGADQAIEFYKKAFGAEEITRIPGPGGKGIMHAELKIGDSMLMMCEEFPDMGAKSPAAIGGSPVTLHLYVQDVDQAFDRAVSAGATVKMPVTDMFWGDRYGRLTDPFGHEWSIATHKQDLTPEEISKGAETAFSKSSCGCQ